MYYASIGFLSLIIHTIINADVLFRKSVGANSKVLGRYRWFLYGVMLYYITDSVWGILVDVRILPLVYLDTFLYFLSVGLSLFLWIRFIVIFLKHKDFWSSFLFYLSCALFAVEIIVLIVNFFIPIMFSFTEDGEYVPGGARYILMGIQLILFALIGIFTLIRGRNTKGSDRLHHNAVGISGLTLMAFVILQAFFPMMPFYAVGLLIATCTIHTFFIVDSRVESSRQIGSYKKAAYKYPLTNVRNSNAYNELKRSYEKKLLNGDIKEFAVAVFDLNDLKLVNDTKGHDAGDKYLQDACSLICRVFQHSPVFRIGGDEFVTLLMNGDFHKREELINDFNKQVDYNLVNGGPVVSAGISLFDSNTDTGYEDVFTRADELMYSRKKELKQRKLQLNK